MKLKKYDLYTKPCFVLAVKSLMGKSIIDLAMEYKNEELKTYIQTLFAHKID